MLPKKLRLQKHFADILAYPELLKREQLWVSLSARETYY